MLAVIRAHKYLHGAQMTHVEIQVSYAVIDSSLTVGRVAT